MHIRVLLRSVAVVYLLLLCIFYNKLDWHITSCLLVLFRLCLSCDDVSDSAVDANGWSKTLPSQITVDFDAIDVIPQQPFSPLDGPVDFFRKVL